MRKLISVLLSVCMALALVPAVSFASEPAADQIQCPAADQVQAAAEVSGAEINPAASAESISEAEQAPAENIWKKGAGEELDQEEIADAPALEAAETGGEWSKDETGWRYLINGVPITGKHVIAGISYQGYYYFDPVTGYLTTGWVTLEDGNKNYYDPTPGEPGGLDSKYGLMVTGKHTIGDGTYYFRENGRMQTGWLTLNGSKYYFDTKTGKMKAGKWLKLSDSKYYFASSGKMVTGLKEIGGHKYYFNKENGKMQTGWHTIEGSKYYFKPSNGHMLFKWQKISGSRYYLGTNGKMVTGLKKIGGSRYYFASNGKMQTGARKISGSLYYFFSSGKAVSSKGWFKGSDKKTRYSLGSGKVATGKKTINGIQYKFSTATGVLTKTLGDKYDRQIASMSSSTKYLVQVIKSSHQVRIYKGSKGNWSRIYTFTCSVGASATPTSGGTFTVQGKTAHHNYKTGGQDAHWNNGLDLTGAGPRGNGFNGYVWSGVYPDGDIIDSTLGRNVTGGRIRVSESNSAWMYNNIGVGTKVYIH